MCEEARAEAAAGTDFDKENGNCSGVWRFTHVHVHGPYLEDKYVLTIRDPWSRWIVARMFDLSSQSDLLSALANFIFSSLCQYGFARCRVFLRGEHEYEAVKDMVAARIEVLANSMAAEKMMFSIDNILEHSGLEDDCCEGLSETLSQLVSECSSDWDSLLDSWLFSQRTNVQKSGRTPFSILFNRDPLGVFGEVESVVPEPASQNRRTLKSSRLQCRHCNDIFTSRVSFKLHQKRHIEQAMRVGAMKGERFDRNFDPVNEEGSERYPSPEGGQDDDDQLFLWKGKPKRSERTQRRRLRAAFNPHSRIAKLRAGAGRSKNRAAGKKSAAQLGKDFADPEEVNEVAENTVTVMKELLEATKEARLRRGKYAKFSIEMQDEIAAFAFEHGVAATLAHYSKRFEHNTITENSIRNFMRGYRRFPPALKENIGKAAYQYGSEKALEIWKKKQSGLGDGLNAITIRRFRRYFLNKNPNLVDNDTASAAAPSASADDDSGLAIFGEPLRDEIGHYAFQFGNVPAVERFSARLQFPMQESTVRKFKRAWMAKNHVAEIAKEPEQRQEEQHVHLIVPELSTNPAGLNISDGDGGHGGGGDVGGNRHGDLGQAPTFSQIGIATGPAKYGNISNLDLQTMGTGTGDEAATDSLLQERPAAVGVPLSLTINAAAGHDEQPPRRSGNQASATSSGLRVHEEAVLVETEHGAIPIIIENESGVQTTTALTVTLPPNEEVLEWAQVKEAAPNSGDEFVQEISSRGRPVKRKVHRSRKVKVKARSAPREASAVEAAARAPLQGSSEKAQKRPYTTYDPELRAKIGRYAMAGHGNQETIDHFREVFGVELPESTVIFSHLLALGGLGCLIRIFTRRFAEFEIGT